MDDTGLGGGRGEHRRPHSRYPGLALVGVAKDLGGCKMMRGCWLGACTEAGAIWVSPIKNETAQGQEVAPAPGLHGILWAPPKTFGELGDLSLTHPAAWGRCFPMLVSWGEVAVGGEGFVLHPPAGRKALPMAGKEEKFPPGPVSRR